MQIVDKRIAVFADTQSECQYTRTHTHTHTHTYTYIYITDWHIFVCISSNSSKPSFLVPFLSFPVWLLYPSGFRKLERKVYSLGVIISILLLPTDHHSSVLIPHFPSSYLIPFLSPSSYTLYRSSFLAYEWRTMRPQWKERLTDLRVYSSSLLSASPVRISQMQ